MHTLCDEYHAFVTHMLIMIFACASRKHDIRHITHAEKVQTSVPNANQFQVLRLFMAIEATSVCRCWLSVTVANRSIIAGQEQGQGQVGLGLVQLLQSSFVDWLEFGTLVYTFTTCAFFFLLHSNFVVGSFRALGWCIVFHGGHFLFTCSDTCRRMYLQPQCTRGGV